MIIFSIVLFFVVLLISLYVSSYSVKVYRFYSPNCSHCKSSKPEWQKFTHSSYFNMIKPININIDSSNAYNKGLINNFGVKGVPTIIAVWSDGFRSEYEGDRSAQSIRNWVKSAHQT